MIKEWPLKESYLLPDDFLCQTISYVTVILTLSFFFSLSDKAHQLAYDWLLCYSVSFISVWIASSIAKSLTRRSSVPTYASILVNVFFIPAKVDSAFPRYLLILYPTLYELHPKDRLEVDTVPFGCYIAGLYGMIYGLLRKSKRNIMVSEAFVFF